MPSPFPGMDPFLEDPQIFPDFHGSFVPYLRAALQEALPSPYFASLGERVWIEASERPIGPDVTITHPRKTPSGGAVSLLPPPGSSRIQLFRVPHDERRETFIEIFTGRRESRRLVTSIELLSPTNKTFGPGRDLYLQKQREILAGQVHLVEIDLLRAGKHSTAVPERLIVSGEPYDYHVCVHQYDFFEDYLVYPILLSERLPSVGFPLLPQDQPVTVDLQAVFNRCYDDGQYQREINYQKDAIVPPLSEAKQEWVDELLRRS